MNCGRRRGSLFLLSIATVLVLGSGCQQAPPHAETTNAEARRIEEAATRLGVGRVASVWGQYSVAQREVLPVRIGLILPGLADTTPMNTLKERLLPFAKETARILRDLTPSRDLRINLYTPTDGFIAWMTFNPNDRETATFREINGDERIFEDDLFRKSVPLPQGLRRGFYLPFIGLPEIALSRGGAEAAYLHLSQAGYARLRPQLEALACGGEGDPLRVRMYGLVLEVRSTAADRLVKDYPLPRLVMAKSPAFSPDGRTIALLGKAAGSPQEGPWKAWLLDRQSGSLRAIFTPPQPIQPRGINALGWSVDGSKLALGLEMLPDLRDGEADPLTWVNGDQTLIFSREGKLLQRVHGRCPSWNPSDSGLVVARDVVRTFAPRPRFPRRYRRRWSHQIVRLTPTAQGSWNEETIGETEGWTFTPPIWQPDGKSYLTVETLSPTGAFGWRSNGSVWRRSVVPTRPSFLGRARLSGSPDGTAYIVRSGRIWRWSVMPKPPNYPSRNMSARSSAIVTRSTRL